ncbi:MAG: hypothetical protein MAG551_00946 [Candidatus Scalindua arabica]|uniref:Uncharacterized protein n=1 Tax=Candidatus Scalindua arabica TaxID=1127984 RepID=A0A941ZZC0_9BACT|nr:hypothetical protein [Candidatus Scalindua arabica]
MKIFQRNVRRERQIKYWTLIEVDKNTGKKQTK